MHGCTENSVCLGWLTLFLELDHMRWDSRSRLCTMLYFCAEINNLSYAAGYLLIETCWEVFSSGGVLIFSFLQNQICVWRKPVLYILFEMDLNHCNPLHSDWVKWSMFVCRCWQCVLNIELWDSFIWQINFNVGTWFLQYNIKIFKIKDFSLYVLQLISCPLSKGIGKKKKNRWHT